MTETLRESEQGDTTRRKNDIHPNAALILHLCNLTVHFNTHTVSQFWFVTELLACMKVESLNGI